MKKFLTIAGLILFANYAFAAEPITGIWKTIDDETNEPKSLIQIYEHDGKYFGRVVKLFKNPDATAADIKGNPKIDGLDVIWDMSDDGKKYKGGKILDPKKGKIYTCEIWRENKDTLIVRGKIGPFGRNQKWIKNESETFQKGLIPNIPEKI